MPSFSMHSTIWIHKQGCITAEKIVTILVGASKEWFTYIMHASQCLFNRVDTEKDVDSVHLCLSGNAAWWFLEISSFVIINQCRSILMIET